jgi:predicted transcriptional regulator
VSRTVVIRVGSVEQARRELKAALTAIVEGERVHQRREIWFATLGQLASVLSERRLEVLRLVHRKRPRSLGQLARLAGRRAEPVRADVRALAEAGLVKLVGVGAAQRPVAAYDRIHLAGDIALARDAA